MIYIINTASEQQQCRAKQQQQFNGPNSNLAVVQYYTGVPNGNRTTKRKKNSHTYATTSTKGCNTHGSGRSRAERSVRRRTTPGSTRSSVQLRRPGGLATSTGDGSTCSDGGVVERLTATGASSRRPRRRHLVRERRRRRTARCSLVSSAPDHDVRSPVPETADHASCQLQQWSRPPVSRTQAAH